MEYLRRKNEGTTEFHTMKTYKKARKDIQFKSL
jgi:hypothetical protein